MFQHDKILTQNFPVINAYCGQQRYAKAPRNANLYTGVYY